MARCLDKLALKEPLEQWSDETVEQVVNIFVDEKFPSIVALNKIDHPDADKVLLLMLSRVPVLTIFQNIAKIAKSMPPERIVLTSAITEVFLRKLAKQKFIRYHEGSEFVDTREDLITDGDPNGGGLKEMDDKLKT